MAPPWSLSTTMLSSHSTPTLPHSPTYPSNSVSRWSSGWERRSGSPISVISSTARLARSESGCVSRTSRTESSRERVSRSATWYSGQKDRSSSSETRWTTISAGVADILGNAAHEDWVYLAPEARVPSDSLPGIPLDIYGFGAVAHLILTGRPPAENLVDLEQKPTQDEALDPRSVAAGIPDEIADVIVLITKAAETDRPSTMAEVLEYLNAAWDGVRKVDAIETPNDVEDPLDAQSGDAIADRFLVLGRRGEGSTGVAFAVNDMDSGDSEREVILKASRAPTADKRLKAEAELLRALDHKRIVRLLDGPFEIAERSALLLSDAGKETLAVRLAKEGRCTLGQLQQFGGNLLDAMTYLEAKGYFHRDVKPANLGIIPDPGTRKPSLVLFDFSLSEESVDNTASGTAGYLDPYLGRGARKRYDRAAELYAVSATLFEMATGGLPWWGSGTSQPLSPDDAPVVEPTAFEPVVAAQFAKLFRKASPTPKPSLGSAVPMNWQRRGTRSLRPLMRETRQPKQIKNSQKPQCWRLRWKNRACLHELAPQQRGSTSPRWVACLVSTRPRSTRSAAWVSPTARRSKLESRSGVAV